MSAPGTLRELLRLDDAVAGLAGDEAGMREQRAMEAEERRRPADLELVEGAEHPHAGVLAVDAVHDQLRDHRVVEARDLRPFDDSRVDPDARTGRLAIGRQPARSREEPARDVLGVDPAFDRVAAQVDVLLAHAKAARRRRCAPARGRGRSRSPPR